MIDEILDVSQCRNGLTFRDLGVKLMHFLFRIRVNFWRWSRERW